MAAETLHPLGGISNNSDTLVAKAERTAVGVATGGKGYESMAWMLIRMKALEEAWREGGSTPSMIISHYYCYYSPSDLHEDLGYHPFIA